MPEVVDLTEEEVEATVVVTKKDVQSRKKRAAEDLAEDLAGVRLGTGGGKRQKLIAELIENVEPHPPASESDDVTLAASRRAAAAATSVPGNATTAAQAVTAQPQSSPGLSLTAQLHRERLARMSEQQKNALRDLGPTGETGAQAPRQPAAPGRSPSQQPVAPSSSTPASVATRSAPAAAHSRPAVSTDPNRPLTLLTYNVWFNEELALGQRMKAIDDILQQEGYPDLVMLQEVTHNIVALFEQMGWFRLYHCSPVPQQPYFTLLLAKRDTVTLPAFNAWVSKDYPMGCMGRGILYTRATINGRPLVVGTTHLESPIGKGPQQMVAERRQQLGVALRELEAAAAAKGDDLVMAGDLNWADNRDGEVPLPPAWRDAWRTLRPGEPGFTYNARANPMLSHRYEGSRLDRVLVRCSPPLAEEQPQVAPGSAADRARRQAGAAADVTGSSGAGGGGGGGSEARRSGWRLWSMKLVGTSALPGVTHTDRFGTKRPVLPSDHFGLLIKLLPADAPPRPAGATGGCTLGNSGAAAAPPAVAVPPSAGAAMPAASGGRVATTSGMAGASAGGAAAREVAAGAAAARAAAAAPQGGSREVQATEGGKAAGAGRPNAGATTAGAGKRQQERAALQRHVSISSSDGEGDAVDLTGDD